MKEKNLNYNKFVTCPNSHDKKYVMNRYKNACPACGETTDDRGYIRGHIVEEWHYSEVNRDNDRNS